MFIIHTDTCEKKRLTEKKEEIVLENILAARVIYGKLFCRSSHWLFKWASCCCTILVLFLALNESCFYETSALGMHVIKSKRNPLSHRPTGWEVDCGKVLLLPIYYLTHSPTLRAFYMIYKALSMNSVQTGVTLHYSHISNDFAVRFYY